MKTPSIFLSLIILSLLYIVPQNAAWAVTSVPSQVTGLSIAQSGSTQLNLSWSVPSNGGTAIQGYYIQKNNGGTYYQQPFFGSPAERSYWKFDGNGTATGNNQTDFGTLGNRANLTLSSGPFVNSTGKIANGYNFTGTSYFTVQHQANYAMERTNSFSIAFWMKHSTSASSGEIFTKNNQTGSVQATGFQLWSDNLLNFDMVKVITTNELRVRAFTINDNAWHHVVWTYSGTSSATGVRLYVDGVNQTLSITANTLTSNIGNTSPVVIGASFDGTIKLPNAAVDDVRFYNQVLTQGQVTTLSGYTLNTPASYSDTGLTPGTQYQYKVSAVNIRGEGTTSAIGSKYTVNIAPTSLSSSLVSSSSARISWTNPTGNFSGFKVEHAIYKGTFSTDVSNTSNSTNRYDLSGLSSNTKYTVAISTNYATGSSDAGTSARSTNYTFYTLPASPTGLTVTQNNAKQVHLSWVDGGGNGTATGFFIEMSTNNGATWSTVIANTGNSSTTFNQNGVAAGKTFWRISEIKSSGGGTSAPSSTTNKIVWQTFTVNARKADGATSFSGSVAQSNATSTNNILNLSPPTAYFNSTYNNQNFTVKDFSTLFIVKKQYNTNTTASSVLNLNTNDFLVTCPLTGASPAIEVFTNATDGHQITSFPAPTCYANNTVKWHPYFTANGQSGNTYTTTIKVKVINATYGTSPTSLTANGTSLLASFVSQYILSGPITVGSGLNNAGLYISLNLAVAPGFQPINFTVGNLSVNGSNPNVNPITFIKSSPSSTISFVNVTYPSGYNMSCNLGYQYAQSNRTYNNLVHTPASQVGYSYTPFKFTNGTNDLVTFNCLDQNTKTTGKYVLTNSISGIPLITQIKNFQSGKYGTSGQFGAIDLITLLVIIISFIGFNRVNESVGIAFCVMLVGGLAYFQIIQWPTVLSAAIAVVIMIALASTKKLPWS